MRIGRIRNIVRLAALAGMLQFSPALGQDEDALIVVTASRSDPGDFSEYYDDEQSAIGLRRRADFFVKPIFVNSDSREAPIRREEVMAMLRATIAAAEREGIALVAGNYTLRPLTAETLEDLTFGNGSRPDTTRVQIYARLPLTGDNPSMDAVDQRIARFVQAIPATGRSYMETGSTSLALANPYQYRPEVVRAVAAEATRYAGYFGNDYGVEIRGLDSELYWQQASETDVFLYISHSFLIRPK